MDLPERPEKIIFCVPDLPVSVDYNPFRIHTPNARMPEVRGKPESRQESLNHYQLLSCVQSIHICADRRRPTLNLHSLRFNGRK